MTITATSQPGCLHGQHDAPTRRHRGPGSGSDESCRGRLATLAAAAGLLAGATVLATTVPASAEDAQGGAATSSLQIVPEPAETGAGSGGGTGAGPGPTSCALLAAKYGDGTPWYEIRLSAVPEVGASKTASAAGVTATVTRLSPGTMSFVATAGISLVFVNAGTYPHESNAVFRYDPPTRGASGLSGTVPSNIIDHVLLCFGSSTTPTPAPSPTPAPTPAAPSGAAPAATASAAPAATPAATGPAVVRAHVVARPSGSASTPPATARLPETGTNTTAIALAGLCLAALGGVAMALAKARGATAR